MSFRWYQVTERDRPYLGECSLITDFLFGESGSRVTKAIATRQ
jgi:hypothetical protein